MGLSLIHIFAVVVEAHHLSLLVQVLNDLGVQLVQLGAVGVEVTGFGLISGPADGGVGALLVGAKLGDEMCIRDRLLVGACGAPNPAVEVATNQELSNRTCDFF